MLLASLLLLAPSQEPIPGLIEIPAGSTLLGADLADQKKRIAAEPTVAKELGAEVPRSKVSLDAFQIGPTEVTNEMYLRFVQSTGYQPPVTWMVLSAEARNALIAEKQKEDPAWVFEGLNKSNWWDEHWQDEGQEWLMLPSQALFPVAGVSRVDARVYCQWSGLRLPTEEEWTRAARGDSKLDYPFGDDFDRKLVACNATMPRNLAFKVLPVNSFPGNASPFGPVDMCGNVWEWTDSGFGPLPGFKPFSVKAKDRTRVDVLPPFDASAPVIRGGAFNSPDFGTRIDRRHGIFAVARMEVVGFRLASSGPPGSNAARYASLNVDAAVLGSVPSAGLDFAKTLGLEKRRYADLAPISATRQDPEDGIPASTPPQGYTVYDGYDSIAITPLRALEESSISKLDKKSTTEGPVGVAMLHSSVSLESPNLLPGSWVIAYLGPMRKKDIEKVVAGEREEWPDLSAITLTEKTPLLIVLDQEGVAKGILETREKLKQSPIRRVEPGIVLNLQESSWDFHFLVLDPRGSKAFVFTGGLRPITASQPLLGRDHWDGEYTILEPLPEE